MTSPRVVAIIQARIGSTRLPGKVMLELAGDTVLSHVVRRARAAQLIDSIVVATTTLPEDDAIATEARRLDAAVFRGSVDDVLARYHGAALGSGAGAVVRITADCPLLDPGVTDTVIERFLSSAGTCDYASNTLVRTFPRGLDVEVFSMAALDSAVRDARNPEEREHVTLFFRHNADRFHLCSVEHGTDLSHHRWTLDTAEDYRFLRTLAAELPIEDGVQQSFTAVAEFLESRRDIMAINAGVQQRAVV